jgi:hypothetical protein
MAFTTTNLIMGVVTFAMLWCSVVDQFRLFATRLDHFS